MTNYIQKLINARKPMYFYWEDVLVDFIGYYRAIFRASNGKLYLFRCFFSDTNIAKEPLKLFTSDTNDISKMTLESIGHLTIISISCYISVNEQLVAMLLLLKGNIIPLDGDVYYISQVVQSLQPFCKQNFKNNLLLGEDIYETE